MKKLYVKPTLQKQVMGVMNKFGNNYYRPIKADIDGVSVQKLLADYGSPLFVFSEKTIRNQYRKLHQAFSTRYPNVQFTWSYKTNYLGAICSILHQEGETAEVVSGFEYEKAVSLGVDPSNIIFNGPYKTDEELKRAFVDGATVNLDNFQEIYRAEKIATELGKQVNIGIRLNMETGIYPRWEKFGFNLETTQTIEAVNRISRSPSLKLVGLHSHIGTFVLDPNSYAMQVEAMVKFMFDIENRFNVSIEYLDLGGGFPSKNKLKGTYLPSDVVTPEIDEYAEKICDTLMRLLPANKYPKLILETGRHIVDEAGFLLTTVFAQKQLSSGVKSYFVDAGINLLYTSTWYNMNIQPAVETKGTPEPVVIYGPLCMNIDVLAESIYMPPLPTGTPLVISPVGAYNVTQWMQFITYRPAVAMVYADGSYGLIRRREKLEDITGPEIIPEHLALK